jgi:hypothetical protein
MYIHYKNHRLILFVKNSLIIIQMKFKYILWTNCRVLL